MKTGRVDLEVYDSADGVGHYMLRLSGNRHGLDYRDKMREGAIGSGLIRTRREVEDSYYIAVDVVRRHAPKFLAGVVASYCYIDRALKRAVTEYRPDADQHAENESPVER